MNKCDYALKYAGLGIRVFPIKRNMKTPAIDNWPDLATTDKDTIKRWWSIDDYNIGVATGNGVIAVDADTKNGKPGLASLEALDLEMLPQSFRTRTPSYGVHVLLRTSAPVANRVDSIDGYRGIDIRGENGYVLGAGSEIDGKTYEVLSNGGIEDMPAEFNAVLSRRVKHKGHTENPVTELDDEIAIAKAIDWLRTSAPDAVEGAGGDDATFRTAAWLRDLGLSEPTALEAMLEHWNDNQSPPWQPDDLAIKVSNAFNYATGTWGGRSVNADFDAPDIDVGDRPTLAPTDIPANVVQAAEAKRRRSRFTIVKGASAIRRALASEHKPLIEGVINRNAFALLYGKPGATKTFNAIDMCVCIAMGKPWANRYETTQHATLYVALEGGVEFDKRVSTAWIHHKANDDTPFFYLSAGINMVRDDEDAKAVIRFAHQIAEQSKFNVGMIVIDTLNRSLSGGDENSNVDMGLFVRHVDLIREETGAAVLVIHHTGKDEAKGARGHSSLLAALDTEIFVSGEGEMSVTKQRDLPEIEELAKSALVDVQIGVDAGGRQLQSAAVEYGESSEFKEPMVLNEEEERFYDVFEALVRRAKSEGRASIITWREWVSGYLAHLTSNGEAGVSERVLVKRAQGIVGAGWVIRKRRDQYVLSRQLE